MESILDRMKREGAEEKIKSFIEKQKYPYKVCGKEVQGVRRGMQRERAQLPCVSRGTG